MKTKQLSTILATLFLFLSISLIQAKGNKTEAGTDMKKILILGLKDNIKSDYYYKGLISEESGIPEDSLELVFNRTIANNMAQQHIEFIPAISSGNCTKVLNYITVKGEKDECTADLSQVDNQCFRDLLSGAGAEYALILNRHYLRKQEQPFNTIFYIVSYSLYDKEKKEISSGSNYFTAMHLESAETMKKTSRKTSDKIASSVLKLVAQQPTETAATLLLSKN